MEITADNIRLVLKDLHLFATTATLTEGIAHRQFVDNGDTEALKKPLEFRSLLSTSMAWILQAAALHSREMPFCRAAKVSIDMATFHMDELQIELRNAFSEIEQWAIEEQSNVYENERQAETITVVELAKVLAISEHSVRRRCEAGEFGMPYLPSGQLRGKVIDVLTLPTEVQEEIKRHKRQNKRH